MSFFNDETSLSTFESGSGGQFRSCLGGGTPKSPFPKLVLCHASRTWRPTRMSQTTSSPSTSGAPPSSSTSDSPARSRPRPAHWGAHPPVGARREARPRSDRGGWSAEWAARPGGAGSWTGMVQMLTRVARAGRCVVEARLGATRSESDAAWGRIRRRPGEGACLTVLRSAKKQLGCVSQLEMTLWRLRRRHVPLWTCRRDPRCWFQIRRLLGSREGPSVGSRV